MQFLDFDVIANYFQEKIKIITYNLQENGELLTDEPNDEKYRFRFYVNKGDYHNAVVELNNAADRRNPEIPVLIGNNGGVQDSSTAIDVYLQKLQFEVYGWCDRENDRLDQWHDVELIFSTLCSELKTHTDTLLGNTIKIDISGYPEFTELENKHFVMFLNVNVLIMFNAQLSNLDKIKVNGIEIPYMNFTEDFTQELIPDNKITTEIKFMPNTYTYILNVTGLYVKSNDVVNMMVEDCTTGNLYNQPFGVEIIRNDNILSVRTMYVRNFQVIRSFGSIVAYKVSLYPAYTGV